MKVFEINTVCGFGSTGRIVVDLGKYVNNVGGECEIAFGRSNTNPGYDKTYFIGSNLDHNIHGFLARITDKQGFYSKKATQKLVEHIIIEKPDVIHLHNLHGYYLNIPVLISFLKQYKKPVIWTFHDCWPFTGHCTYFDKVNCDKWQSECYECPQKNAYPTSWVFDRSCRNYHYKKSIFQDFKNLHIVTPSNWLKDLVSKSFLSNIDCRVINNGIDLTKFSREAGIIRRKYGIEEKRILLGVASLWGERKGFQDFIELSKIVDTNTVIILVGVNKEQKKILPQSIIGIERTNDVRELCQFYSDADYFLNLTYQDNFPTANIEALACGTPVVTYKTGGSTEICDIHSGIVIEKGHYESVLDLKRGAFLPSSCIERSRCYDAQKKYAEYYQLYLEVLSESK